jgi:two-component system heavy metal sensor histidine kinase CusS
MSLRNRAPASIALRLSTWYAGSAFLLLLIGTGFLYWKLVQGFDSEDDQSVSEKINTLSKLVTSHDQATLRWEVEGESATRPSAEVLSRVLGPDGRVIVETTGMSALLPAQAFPEENLLRYCTHGRRIFRVLARRLPEGYRIQVGLEVTFEKSLLASYRLGLWVVLGVGLSLSVLAGIGIARRGIRPLNEIAGTLQRIGSSTLSERVETAGLPSELWSLASAFNETLDRLQDAFSRLARFSSDIAHELRTPINNMRGEVEVALSRGRSPGEYREVLESSLEECLRLSRIIDILLFIARAEHPGAQIHREHFDVGSELAALRDFYEPAAGEAGIRLELEASPDLCTSVDRTLFQRALGNLIENSLAHTGPGGHIRLEAHSTDGKLQVTVTDDGCGIPAEHLPNVFDRFHRVDAARSQNKGGVGLGLAIVKSVAALHGGDAEIASTLGQGTRVTLHFPPVAST